MRRKINREYENQILIYISYVVSLACKIADYDEFYVLVVSVDNLLSIFDTRVINADFLFIGDLTSKKKRAEMVLVPIESVPVKTRLVPSFSKSLNQQF